MKARTKLLSARRLLAAVALTAAAFAPAPAQSGRVFPTPEPTPTRFSACLSGPKM